ncbi:MAG: hypothetical protein V4538_01705 [Bacteroidota bacterium]
MKIQFKTYGGKEQTTSLKEILEDINAIHNANDLQEVMSQSNAMKSTLCSMIEIFYKKGLLTTDDIANILEQLRFSFDEDTLKIIAE